MAIKQSEAEINYELNPKKCKNCNINIPYKKRVNNFCTHECCGKFHNPTRIFYNCKLCGKTIKQGKNGKERIFCTHTCQHEYNFQNYIKNWKNGNEIKEENVSGFIRKYLFKKYNNMCCKCGWSKINPKSNKIPLQINHIDGNHKNNNELNLELLCPNCHSLTENYGALNKGKGRMQRMKRYKEGKTY